ncbi:MAG TPA: NAD(P)H-dependent oxidoreductase [Rhizomicrobium sp.]|jgi:NAD(P)H-dependent FMN reductase|nr:NAD(P)H-dependent oxidoreductase [Rhizomicrobium sp.]
MAFKVLVFYGSFRQTRVGIRMANYAMQKLVADGFDAELIDARALDLPMLDRMYKEYAPGTAPAVMETLAKKIRAADAFLFVCGEYNWGVQPGLKNLTDHFLEEWFWRPAAVVSYSAQRAGGARANVAWHGILSEMGMVVISSTIAIGQVSQALDEDAKPIGEFGAYLEKAFPRLVADLKWWTEAARAQRVTRKPPY